MTTRVLHGIRPGPAVRPVRIDPAGCQCTDCLTRYSVPLEQASDELVLSMLQGEIENATGSPAEKFLVVADGLGQLLKIVRPGGFDEAVRVLRGMRAS